MSTNDDFIWNFSLRGRIKANLDAFDAVRHENDGLIHAAVAVTVFNHDDEGAVIVTRRSHRLKDHTGQWAMPGGRFDN